MTPRHTVVLFQPVPRLGWTESLCAEKYIPALLLAAQNDDNNDGNEYWEASFIISRARENFAVITRKQVWLSQGFAFPIVIQIP